MAELLEAGRLCAVVPILIGELSLADASDGGGGSSGGGGNAPMGSLFCSRAYEGLSSVAHGRVNARAAEVLADLGVEPTPRLPLRTVREVVEVILLHLGIAAHEFFPKMATAAVSVGAARVGRQHVWEAGIRTLVGGARKRLMTALETVLQRGEEASVEATRAADSATVEASSSQASAPQELAHLDSATPPPARPAAADPSPLRGVAPSPRVAEGTGQGGRAGSSATDGWAEVELARLRAELEAERARTLQARLEAERAGLEAERALMQAKAEAERALAALARVEAEAAASERSRASAAEHAKAFDREQARAQSACCRVC